MKKSKILARSFTFKSSSLILIIILFSGIIKAQNKQTISLDFGVGGCMALLDGFEKIDGFSNDGSVTIGIHYQRNLSEKIAFKTGLEYCGNDLLVAKGYNPYNRQQETTSWDIEILSLPLFFNYKFLNYLFIEFGPTVDLNFNVFDSQPIDTQSGIGLGSGIGVLYQHKNLVFTLNPYLNCRAIVPFIEPYANDHIMESGIKFGVGYQF